MVEQRDARLDQDQRAEVRIATADRRRRRSRPRRRPHPPALRRRRDRGPRGRSPRCHPSPHAERGPSCDGRRARRRPRVLAGSTSGATLGSWTWTCGAPSVTGRSATGLREIRSRPCPWASRMRVAHGPRGRATQGRTGRRAVRRRRRRGTPMPVARSSSAWVTAPSLPVRPASIRESSWTRSSSDRGRTVAVPASFSTRMWRSAKHAICGRWVTTSTWRPSARRASRRPDREPCLPSDARVHLVEHERRHVVEVGHHAATREHRARELATRRRLGERRCLLPRRRREPELDDLGPRRPELGGRIQLDRDRGAGHPELLQLALERRRERRRRIGPAPGENGGPDLQVRVGPFGFLGQLRQALIGRGERRQPRRRLLQERQHVGLRRPVLALQPFQDRQAFTDLLETGGVGRQAFAVGTDVAGQLGELVGQAPRSLGQSLGARVEPSRLGERVRRGRRRVAQRGVSRERLLRLRRRARAVARRARDEPPRRSAVPSRRRSGPPPRSR